MSRRIFSAVLLVVFTLALSTLSWTAQSQFLVAKNFPAGNFPVSVAVGDFNGDGKPDVAFLNALPNLVSVRLGNGNGTFQAAKLFPSGAAQPVSVNVADVNNDGKLDLVIFNSPVDGSAATVSILLGNGDGTFQSPKNSTIGSFPTVVALGDFNGDGHTDMVVSSPGSYDPLAPPSLLLLLGNGDGTFQTAKEIFPGSEPEWVAVGDFNGDGKADLAVANGSPAAMSIMLGNGDGTFQTAKNVTGVGVPLCVVAQDVNGDHILDLIVGDSSNNSIAVLRGKGDGTFQAAQTFAVGLQVSFLMTGDFNGDNKVDVAAIARGAGPVAVLLGNGDGTFRRANLFDAGGGVTSFGAGDFNGDKRLDLIAVNDLKPGSMTLLPGKGDGTFQAARNFATFAQPLSTVVGDFNGDGKQDVVFVANFPTTLTVLLGNGDGTFRPPKNTALTGGDTVVSADFNHDGKLDLAITDINNGTVNVLLGNGDGTFQTAVKYSTTSFPTSVAVGDFNNDGKLDLLLSTGSVSFAFGDFNVLLGNGDGTFQSPIRIPFKGSTQVVVGDFNRDGNLDFIAAQDTFTDLTLYLGKGNGQFQVPVKLPNGGGGPMLVGDLNKDSKLDLIVGVQGGAQFNQFGVNVMLGNGDGSFQNPVFTATAVKNPPFLASEDFNRDGNLDLVLGTFVDSSVTLLLGDGKGGFQTSVSFPVASIPTGLVVGDFNGDQAPDVALGLPGEAGVSNTGGVALLLNTGKR